MSVELHTNPTRAGSSLDAPSPLGEPHVGDRFVDHGRPKSLNRTRIHDSTTTTR